MYQIPSGKGFRNFNRVSNIYQTNFGIKKLRSPLRVFQAEDLTNENPFEINNQVSLIFAEKNKGTKYPIKYFKWTGERTHELLDYKAEPSDKLDALSTWMIYNGEAPVKNIGKFDYTIRQGINFGTRPPFFDLQLILDKGHLVQISNLDGKIKDIEKDKVYPIIKSRHLYKWRIGDSKGERYTYCILPQSTPTEKNEDEMKVKYPKTWDWLNDFRSELLSRKSKVFVKDPFYSIYGLGDWDSKYKVVWQSMGFYPDFVVVSSVQYKVLGKKLLLPEHVLYFVPTNNEDEAHYICAFLNSTPVRETLLTLTEGGKSGISKAILSKVRLDKFNPHDSIHKKLVGLSKKAHGLAEKDAHELDEIQKEIDILVKQICKKKPLTL